MTAYDWLMAFGVIVVIVFVVKAFRSGQKVDSIEQPDNWPPDSPSANN